MRNLKQKSFFVTVLLFWIFSSIPRVWYLYQEGGLMLNKTLAIQTLALGFLQDGILVSIFLLGLQLSHTWIFRQSLPFQSIAHFSFSLVLAVILSVMMANVEFFRIFGSNANFTHLVFISESEVLAPSLKVIFPWYKILLGLILVPGLFFFLSKAIFAWKLDHFLQKKAALLLPIITMSIGLLAFQKADTSDPLRKNLENNYVLSFLWYSISGDDIRGKSVEPIATLLDPIPLTSGQKANNEWVLFDPKFPLMKATAHQLCESGRWTGAVCSKDEDHDGYPVRTDCNDTNASIHPGAFDRPGNGIDEDCSGLDANAPNVIFIHWEGARAVNVGSIGYSDAVTPQFDALSKKGRLFKNAYANGTQTRWSLTSIYNSILPRLSTKWIFKHNPELNILAFPKILKDHGYQTIYVHSGDISFGNFRERFSDWFEMMIDKRTAPIQKMDRLGWGPRDKDLYDYCYQFLKSRTDARPFYMTIATLSEHHPFYLPDKKHQLFPHTTMANKYKNILHYADEQLGVFVNRLLSDPQFKNTIVLIASDHGINVGEPHGTTAQSTLWEDLVWVPLLLVGDAWNIQPGVDTDVRQLADIGPTILDRLGIEIPNHFIGHSLLKSYPPGSSHRVFFGNANGGISAGLREGDYKFIYYFKRNQGRLYNMVLDRRETKDLCLEPAYHSVCEDFAKKMMDVYVQHGQLIMENRIWDPSFQKK